MIWRMMRLRWQNINMLWAKSMRPVTTKRKISSVEVLHTEVEVLKPIIRVYLGISNRLAKMRRLSNHPILWCLYAPATAARMAFVFTTVFRDVIRRCTIVLFLFDKQPLWYTMSSHSASTWAMPTNMRETCIHCIARCQQWYQSRSYRRR